MRQIFIAQFIQSLKCQLCNMWSGIAVKKNQVLSVEQCWLQAVQFSVNLLNILFTWNGFTGLLITCTLHYFYFNSELISMTISSTSPTQEKKATFKLRQS